MVNYDKLARIQQEAPQAVDVFVSKDLLVDQDKQLERMNKDKPGRPYVYSDALMLIILAVKEYFGLPYRQTEGFTRLLGGIWGRCLTHRYAGDRRSSTYLLE
jgi:hypothetical protein